MNHRALQRMRNRSDQFSARISRQLRVRIQCDDVLDSRQRGPIAGDRRKIIVPSQQQIIQIEQLSAFPFPSHPHFFAGIERAIAVEQKKCPFVLVRVPLIELFNQSCALCGQFIAFIVLRRCVGRIGKQTKMKIAVAVPEKPDLQVANGSFHLLATGQQRWNHHQRFAGFGNSLAVIHFWKRPRSDEHHRQLIRNRHRAFRGWKNEQSHNQENWHAHFRANDHRRQQRNHQQLNSNDIDAIGPALQKFCESCKDRIFDSQRLF